MYKTIATLCSDIYENWEEENIILPKGLLIFCEDKQSFYLGDGETNFTNLQSYSLENEVSFYVDSENGDDNKGGSKKNPFKTLNRALSMGFPHLKTNIYLKKGSTFQLDDCFYFYGNGVNIRSYGTGINPKINQEDKSGFYLTNSYVNVIGVDVFTSDVSGNSFLKNCCGTHGTFSIENANVVLRSGDMAQANEEGVIPYTLSFVDSKISYLNSENSPKLLNENKAFYTRSVVKKDVYENEIKDSISPDVKNVLYRGENFLGWRIEDVREASFTELKKSSLVLLLMWFDIFHRRDDEISFSRNVLDTYLREEHLLENVKKIQGVTTTEPVTLNTDEWVQYVLELRSIEKKYSNPEDVVFPVRPKIVDALDTII